MNIDCPPHIRRTLEEITAEITGRQGEIQKLIDVRTSLCELYDIPAELPMGNLREKKPHKARKTKTAPAALASPATPPLSENSATPAGFSRPPSPESIELMAHARRMPEPVSAVTLSVASGKDRIFCTNSINRWAAKGWLEKTGRGEYKRTNTFPSQA